MAFIALSPYLEQFLLDIQPGFAFINFSLFYMKAKKVQQNVDTQEE